MPSKKNPHDNKSNNLIAIVALIVLGAVTITDLMLPNDVPNFIYFGLIGSALGAKFDEIFTIGGKK